MRVVARAGSSKINTTMYRDIIYPTVLSSTYKSIWKPTGDMLSKMKQKDKLFDLQKKVHLNLEIKSLKDDRQCEP